MRKLTSRLLVLGCLMAGAAQAQQLIPPPKTEFLDSNYRVLTSSTGACYRRETAFADSVGGTVRNYYISGQLESVATYDNIREKVLQGAFESWYPDGKKRRHENYTHGKKQGEFRSYYTSGQVHRQETYDNDQLVQGQCFGSDGKPDKCVVYPVYSEGDGSHQAIIDAITRRIVYPPAALKANKQGRVVVSFLVTSQGKVSNVKIKEGVSPAINKAAIEAIRQLGPFQPGSLEGKAVAIGYTLPINFKLPSAD